MNDARIDRIVEGMRRLRDEIERLIEDVAGSANALAEQPSADASDPADDFAAHNMIDTWAAAARFDYPQDTVRKWCRQGCGRRVGGRWMVSIAKVRRRIDGGA